MVGDVNSVNANPNLRRRIICSRYEIIGQTPTYPKNGLGRVSLIQQGLEKEIDSTDTGVLVSWIGNA
jgi:hypothetical protein